MGSCRRHLVTGHHFVHIQTFLSFTTWKFCYWHINVERWRRTEVVCLFDNVVVVRQGNHTFEMWLRKSLKRCVVLFADSLSL